MAAAPAPAGLYADPRSSSCLRVLAYLRHKGIALPVWNIDLLAGEHRQSRAAPVFAGTSVPVLALGPEGPWLSQTLAILCWLEALHPTPSTVPEDPVARVCMQELCSYVASELHAVTNLRVRRYVGMRWGEAEALAWNTHWMQQGLQPLDVLVARTVGRCAVGDTLTQADFFLWPALRNAERAGLDLQAYPHLGPLFSRYGTMDCFSALVS